MKRPKAARRRAAQKSRHATPTPNPNPAPTLDAQGIEYITRLAAVLRDVMDAQRRWIPEIDAASRDQGLVNDLAWRGRITSAMGELAIAAEGLRISPVPDNMQAMDGALGQARDEARHAAQGFQQAVANADLRTMLAAVEHVDRMNAFIQHARSLVS